MSQKVELLPYNPLFSKWFEQEAQNLKRALGGSGVAIHHIGSTAIPGLCAKPTLDISAVVTDTHTLISSLEKNGYILGRNQHPLPFLFHKKNAFPK